MRGPDFISLILMIIGLIGVIMLASYAFFGMTSEPTTAVTYCNDCAFKLISLYGACTIIGIGGFFGRMK